MTFHSFNVVHRSMSCRNRGRCYSKFAKRTDVTRSNPGRLAARQRTVPSQNWTTSCHRGGESRKLFNVLTRCLLFKPRMRCISRESESSFQEFAGRQFAMFLTSSSPLEARLCLRSTTTVRDIHVVERV